MTYDESIAWLYSTQTVGIKLGLENIARLLATLGVETKPRPGSGPIVFHVAGTNGKGSVCAMLDAICRAAGYRTALFTSPHLVTFRERIRLNGDMIPGSDVMDGIAQIKKLSSNWPQHPTFFEITTALALAWFQMQKAEVIVLETGLGGRLDATNAITPAVSVITPLSFDHRYYLGNTLAEIAAEKAGIFKLGVPVVSSPQPDEAARVLKETAARIGTRIQWTNKPARYAVALHGSHQKLNAALAISALQAAPVAIPQSAIERGLRDVVWPGRFQQITGPMGVPIVLDGAHNEAAAVLLVQTWQEVRKAEKPVILLGILQDKDVPAICRELAPLASGFVVTSVQNARSCTGAALAETVRNAAPGIPCIIVQSAKDGLALAQNNAQALKCSVLVTGSLFLIGEILALLNGVKSESSTQ